MSGSESCDAAMLELFRAEMDTHVPVLNQGLLALEKGQGSQKGFEAMMRAAHSIKGAARIVGLETAVRISHALEDCFSAAQADRIALGTEAVDVLLQGVDALQRVCSLQPDSPMPEEAVRALLDEVAGIPDGRRAARPAAPASSAAPSPDRAEAPVTVASELTVVLPAVLDPQAAEFYRAQLADALLREPARIRLDFSQVRHLSSAALSMLASFVQELCRTEPAPVLKARDVPGPVAVLLRVTGLEGAFAPGD
jgi:chemotaxis protein histidine kinase CheA